jgi:hypothetical protein
MILHTNTKQIFIQRKVLPRDSFNVQIIIEQRQWILLVTVLVLLTNIYHASITAFTPLENRSHRRLQNIEAIPRRTTLIDSTINTDINLTTPLPTTQSTTVQSIYNTIPNTSMSKVSPRFLRREMIGTLITTISSPLMMMTSQRAPCWAMDDKSSLFVNDVGTTTSSSSTNSLLQPESMYLPNGLLESRVIENVLSYPPYGMELSDIYYPSWFYGTWDVASTTTSVQAPLGISVFGTNATYQAALAEVGTTLRYESRFIDIGGGAGNPTNDNSTTPTVIADRGYNVQSIATAALGRNSIVDLPYVSANKLTAILSPIGSPNPIRVDLFTINRRQETIDENHFHCSEVVREIVSSIGNKDKNSSSRGTTTSTILKEVETTTLYTLMVGKNNDITIQGRQRSANFLVPTQNDAQSFRLWEMTRGKPVDVRFYDVLYTKKIK